MKTNRDQLNQAFHHLRDDTLEEVLTAMEAPRITKTRPLRRWLAATAACLTATLVLGAVLALPMMGKNDPAATLPPTMENVPVYHEAPIVRLMNLSANEDPGKEGDDIILGLAEDIRVSHDYYFMFQTLEEGETLTVSSRYSTLAQAEYGRHDNEGPVQIIPETYIQAVTDYRQTLTFDPSLSEGCDPAFLWEYRFISEDGRTDGNIYEDYVDFIIRNAEGQITGAGSIYLADQKVMSIEENNPYFKTFSISRGRVLGSVRFEHPADVTREQTDSLLAEMHEKAAGLATEIFDGSTFTSDEMLIKNWAKILETDYPEYLHDDAPALVQRGFGKLMEGIHSLLMIAEPESYTELRSIFFFEDGTYAIAEHENIKCVCPECGEIEYLKHPFFTQVHNTPNDLEAYRHMQDTYWIFDLNDGRTMKVSLVDKTYTFISEPETTT